MNGLTQTNTNFSRLSDKYKFKDSNIIFTRILSMKISPRNIVNGLTQTNRNFNRLSDIYKFKDSNIISTQIL